MQRRSRCKYLGVFVLQGCGLVSAGVKPSVVFPVGCRFLVWAFPFEHWQVLSRCWC